MNKKYAIFDMDGTLIDSMGIWENLGSEYLYSKGITENIEHITEEIAALTMSESAALFAERFLPNLDGTAVAKEMNEIMDNHYKKDIPLKKGVKEYLDLLKKSGVRMCVASATEECLMKACLERLEILSDFEFILSCETINTSKREPAIYLEAARRWNAQPDEIAVYEDAKYAAETAKRAGFYVIAVYDKAEKQWRQICETADETINFN